MQKRARTSACRPTPAFAELQSLLLGLRSPLKVVSDDQYREATPHQVEYNEDQWLHGALQQWTTLSAWNDPCKVLSFAIEADACHVLARAVVERWSGDQFTIQEHGGGKAHVVLGGYCAL